MAEKKTRRERRVRLDLGKQEYDGGQVNPPGRSGKKLRGKQAVQFLAAIARPTETAWGDGIQCAAF